ncbi:DNA repair protein XRCC2-like [Acipenser oxyrinchus oxyrinchus]|uniref:DNA repair protein XRCC2-like n=1 Tax=Acipenser oxyrinchus oxyrinchus TaxID=40147 RepID=A0AAD8GGY3_ACIOX|nr:DNA repair protein XRCC2-like [Acipenser oxyrinchus oxyrinchus]
MTHDFRQTETGTELLARLEGRRSLKSLEPQIFAGEGFPVQGDVIEFHGAEGTGKTETLYHLVSRCILPTAAGGLELEVLFIDMDSHFDMLRLVSILEQRLPQSSEETVRQCLRRLFLVHCSSTVQLLLTLHYLENMLWTVVDSISAFYWIDRNGGGESLAQQEASLRKCTELLEKLISDYHLVLFASTQAIVQWYAPEASRTAEAGTPWKQRPSADAGYSKPYLCRSWQSMVTHKMVFSKKTLVDTLKDDKQVFSVVSSHTKSKITSRCSFLITDGGAQFL